MSDITGKKSIVIVMSPELHKKIRTASHADGVSMAEIARKAFADYAKKFKKRKLKERAQRRAEKREQF